MKTKILIVFLLALLPVGGCKVRKSYKEQVKLNAKLQQDRDSISVRYRDSMQTLSLVRNTLKETVNRMEKVSAERIAGNLNIEKRTALEPVRIPGKTFSTTITGNFMLDTSAIKDGKLVYFDVENEDVRVTAYRENGQMKALVETKEKTVNVPVNEVRITQSKETTKKSMDKAENTEKVIDNNSLQEMTKVLNSDSVQAIENVKAEIKSEIKTESSKAWQPAWLAIIIVAAFVIVSFYFVWRLWKVGMFSK